MGRPAHVRAHWTRLGRKSKQYCDATIMCEGRFFPVHRIVLGMCSSYFEKIFDYLDCKNPVIVLADIKSAYLEVLLSYMYSGEANILQKLLPGVLHTASVLKVKGLSENIDDHTQVDIDRGVIMPKPSDIQCNRKLTMKNTNFVSLQQEKECSSRSADCDSQHTASNQIRQTELSRQALSSSPAINENTGDNLAYSSALSIVPDSEINLVGSNSVSQKLGELPLNSIPESNNCHEALVLWRDNRSLLTRNSTNERQTSSTNSPMNPSYKSIMEEIDLKNDITEFFPEICSVKGVGNDDNIDECLHSTNTGSSSEANILGIRTSRVSNSIPVNATEESRAPQDTSPRRVCQTEMVSAIHNLNASGTSSINEHENNDANVARNSMVLFNGEITEEDSNSSGYPEEFYGFPSRATNMELDETTCSNQELENKLQSCSGITSNNGNKSISDLRGCCSGVSSESLELNAKILNPNRNCNSDTKDLTTSSGATHTSETLPVRKRGRPKKVKRQYRPKIKTVLSNSTSQHTGVCDSQGERRVGLQKMCDQRQQKEDIRRKAFPRSSTFYKKIVEKADKTPELCENVRFDSHQSFQEPIKYTLPGTKEDNQNNVFCVSNEMFCGVDPNFSGCCKKESSACNLCLYKSSSKETLSKHIQTHLENGVYVCQICSFISKYLKTANGHACTQREKLLYSCVPVLTDTKVDTYFCNKCAYQSKKALNLVDHIVIHEKPYACKHCPYRCKDKARLKGHMLIHTGEKPFSCRFCSHRASYYCNLRRHELTMHRNRVTTRKFKK
ncbi:uncharacterized protein [Cherax quadricarinatus]|uniref:uncharacterized protein isoform X2 n=1 Tax=Cherax quadricarinatus TaxID=27406 RepID=UPI00387E79BA